MFYQYLCEANGRIIEVSHPLKEKVKTWGDLCQRAGIEPGQTDPQTPVVRLIGGMPFIERLKGLDKDAPGPKHLTL